MQTLILHIRKFVPVSEEEATAICSFFTPIHATKKEDLLAEGKSCPYLYFVESGCLRMYFNDDKGVEQTIQFALENWWMTEMEAFNKQKKASFHIQAIENSALTAITKSNLDSLLETHPILEKYFRLIYERAYSASLFRIKFLRLSKEKAYELFSRSYPQFVQRIPQKLLASFLAFTPEYLSELRKKRSHQKK